MTNIRIQRAPQVTIHIERLNTPLRIIPAEAISPSDATRPFPVRIHLKRLNRPFRIVRAEAISPSDRTGTIEDALTALEAVVANLQAAPGGDGASRGEQVFTGQTTITVNHYRGYRPVVAVTALNGDEIGGAVQHLSLNSFLLSFNLPQSGRITYL